MNNWPMSRSLKDLNISAEFLPAMDILTKTDKKLTLRISLEKNRVHIEVA